VECILFIVVAVVVLMFIGAMRGPSTSSTSNRRGSESSDGATGKQRILKANEPWLKDRWHMASAQKAAGDLRHFPRWYFDEATDRQRAGLVADGVRITPGASKGQLSDTIGLFEEPDSEDLEKLKFFGIALKGPMLNQTRARHEVALLDSDPEKQCARLARPASANSSGTPTPGNCAAQRLQVGRRGSDSADRGAGLVTKPKPLSKERRRPVDCRGEIDTRLNRHSRVRLLILESRTSTTSRLACKTERFLQKFVGSLRT